MVTQQICLRFSAIGFTKGPVLVSISYGNTSPKPNIHRAWWATLTLIANPNLQVHAGTLTLALSPIWQQNDKVLYFFGWNQNNNYLSLCCHNYLKIMGT